jgi:hypothetical protein
MLRPVFAFCLLVLGSVARAELGECRYDAAACSCKMGEENQGVCWDPLRDDPLSCKPRACKRGWTCACGGRTHVCHVGQLSTKRNTGAAVTMAQILKSPQDFSPVVRQEKSSALHRPCSTQTAKTATKTDIKLGTIKFQLSSTGALANQCNYVAWFHNGKIMGNYKKEAAAVTDSTLPAVSAKREDHSLLELRPGDLISFRTKEASYHCYRHLTEFSVDGAAVDSTAVGFETRFAREHSEGWEKKEFKPVLAEVETKTNLKSFTPLRTHRLPKTETSTERGPAIIPGADMWRPPANTSAGEAYDQNDKISNFYYRIQVGLTARGVPVVLHVTSLRILTKFPPSAPTSSTPSVRSTTDSGEFCRPSRTWQ